MAMFNRVTVTEIAAGVNIPTVGVHTCLANPLVVAGNAIARGAFIAMFRGLASPCPEFCPCPQHRRWGADGDGADQVLPKQRRVGFGHAAGGALRWGIRAGGVTHRRQNDEQ
jgi:hypothetical protein